jgi:acetate kinase
MAAVRNGVSIDTSMGFTPTSGLPMSTRSGDLDPGLVSYLARTEGHDRGPVSPHGECGVRALGDLGDSVPISAISSRTRASDTRAAEAVALFCYQGKKWIGAYAAALGGVEQLVFSGGIGEHSAVVRARMCEGLDFLGIHLDRRCQPGQCPDHFQPARAA